MTQHYPHHLPVIGQPNLPFHHMVAMDSSRFSLKVLKREDWIAATFSAYFWMKLSNHRPSSNTEVPDSATAELPISTSMPVTSFTKIAMSCA